MNLSPGSRLRIASITTVEGGKYTCCGISANKAVCTSSEVTVKSRMIIETKLQNQTLISPEDLILECQIRGVTNGFRWLYNDELIMGGKKEFFKEGSRFTYNHSITDDSGKYTCCGYTHDDVACTSSEVTVMLKDETDDDDNENGTSFAYLVIRCYLYFDTYHFLSVPRDIILRTISRETTLVRQIK